MTIRQAFTETYIKSLKPQAKRYTVWCSEVPGWGVRVSGRTGRKAFIVQAIPLGSSKQVRLTLGVFNQMRFSVARQKAIEALENLKKGHVRRESELMSLKVLAEEFLSHKEMDKNVEPYLRRDFLGQLQVHSTRFEGGRYVRTTTWADGPERLLRDRPAAYITKEEIVARLDEIRKTRGPWASWHALTSISRLFHWAAAGSRGGVTVAVTSGLSSRVIGLGSAEKMRSRYLREAEFKAVWAACDSLAVFGVLVKVLMVTGQRRSDWLNARWSEIESDVLYIPAKRYKARREHSLPITPLVRSLIAELPRFEGSDWIFTLDGRQPIGSISKGLAKLKKLSGVSDFHLHDLRRTFRTMIREIGVPFATAEIIIGHRSTLDRTYDLGQHLAEKREALLRFERHVLDLTTPPERGNVVRLRA